MKKRVDQVNNDKLNCSSRPFEAGTQAMTSHTRLETCFEANSRLTLEYL